MAGRGASGRRGGVHHLLGCAKLARERTYFFRPGNVSGPGQPRWDSVKTLCDFQRRTVGMHKCRMFYPVFAISPENGPSDRWIRGRFWKFLMIFCRSPSRHGGISVTPPSNFDGSEFIILTNKMISKLKTLLLKHQNSVLTHSDTSE